MRWVCPRCGRSVSVALETCPHCPPLGSPPQAGSPAPPAADSQRAATPALGPPAGVSAGEESPLWRGIQFGVGFMLAVVVILLLVVMVLLWLSAHPEWRERLEQLGV
ncbi:MAG: hypothetical protein HY653_07565 [Acidobacteria bacterium]|nr:hypothetical protein [Acidobacteriota bacterium]